MKKFLSLLNPKTFTLFLSLILFGQSYGQTPFTCQAGFYQVLSGQLTELDVATSTFANIGGVNPGYNAIGYNVLDNLIYGLDPDDNLLLIDATGTVTNLGAVAGLPVSGVPNYNAGDFDLAGNFYVMLGGSIGTIEVIDVVGLTSTTLTLSSSVNVFDLAFNPVDGLLYGIEAGASSLIIIDPATGIVSSFGITIPAGDYGAVWAASDGNVYAFNNATGDIFTIAPSIGYQVFLSTTTAPSSNNDGASCPSAAPPVITIPTVGEWGLIVLCLSLLGLIVLGFRSQTFTLNSLILNFDKNLYFNSLIWSLGLALLVGGLNIFLYGTISSIDLIGAAIVIPILSWFIHNLRIEINPQIQEIKA